jgi:hypothetical protein
MKHVSAGYVDSTTETHDDPSQPREVGVLRRTLLRAQEIIRGLAQGNGELRKELQALWARNQALELQLKEKSNILPFRSGTFDRNLLKDYREVVRQRDDLMQQRDKLCRDGDIFSKALARTQEQLDRTVELYGDTHTALCLEQEKVRDLTKVVQMRRGFSKQYLATVDLEQRIERAEFEYASAQGASSWVRRTHTRLEKGPFAR